MTPVPQVDAEVPRARPWAFLSHPTADKKRLVEPFARRLQERGIAVWVDQERIGPGDSMVGRVFTEGIGLAGAGIVVLSRHSAGSRWLEQELSALVARKIQDGIPLIVLRLDDVPVPVLLIDEYRVDIVPGTDWSAQLNLVVRALAGAAGTGPLPDPPARLRRMLEDPRQWLAADDAIRTVTDGTVRRLTREPPPPRHGPLPDQVRQLLGWYEEVTGPLVEAVAGCAYGGDPDQPGRWMRPLRRVLRTAVPAEGRGSAEVWERIAWYPALRLAYAIGVGAVAGGQEGLLHPLLGQQVPTARELRPLWRALSPDGVIDPGLAQLLPGWTGSCRALSIHLRATLRPAFDGILAEDEYAEAFERYEYLRSLLELHASDGRTTSLGEFGWLLHDGRTLVAARIAEEVAALGTSWPLLRAGAFGGREAAVRAAQARLREHLRRRFF